MTVIADEWFVTRVPRPRAPVQLLCLPYAGAGAAAYRAWPAALGTDVEVSALRLPGRERRFAEPAVIVPRLIALAVMAHVDRPYALFGHSMGARLAYAVIHELADAGGPLPRHLFVSGSAPPDEPRRLGDPYDGLSTVADDALLARLSTIGGTPPELLAEPEMLALMLPTLRADFAWLESYVHRPRPPLPVPITAFAGADDPVAAPDRMPGWQRLSGGAFTLHTLPGGHFFVADRLDEVAAAIRGALGQHAPSPTFAPSRSTAVDTDITPVAAAPEPCWAGAASFAQERIWLASQVTVDAPVYHVLDRFHVPARIEPDQLREALAVVVDRHETLRTAFRVDDGVLTQVVHPAPLGDVNVSDLRGLDPDAQPEEIFTRLRGLVFERFDLGRPPLWRAMAARVADAEWVVVMIAHHTIFDGASVFNLHNELREACTAIEQGRPARLPDLPIQYADYAAWQRDQVARRLDDLLDFWRTTLADLPPVHGLRTDRPRPAERGFAGADVLATLPAEALALLPELARRLRTTPFTVLLTAYLAMIHRCSGRDDVVVGIPVTGRDLPELEPLIGMFVNMVVLRVRVSPEMTFTALAEATRTAWLAAFEHRDMPFQRLVEALGLPRDPGVPPIYQLGFNQLDTPGFSSTSQTAEDDLLLEVCADSVRVEYNTALFTTETATMLLDDYVRVLAAGLADPDTRLDLLPVLGAAHEAPEPARATDALKETRPAYVAPRTAAEELVVQVWAEVLDAERVGGPDRIGALDNFFDLGGHSLLALRVIARLNGMVGVELPIEAFFGDTTVAGVAAALEAVLAAELDELTEDEALRLVGEE